MRQLNKKLKDFLSLSFFYAMINSLKYLFKNYLYFLVIYAISRMVFIVYNLNSFNISFKEAVLSFVYAWRVDTVMACYVLVIPTLLLSLNFLYPNKVTHYIVKVLVMIFTLINAMIMIGDIGIYKEWNTKINYKALTYLKDVNEVVRTSTNSLLISGAVLFLLMLILSYYLYQKIVPKNIHVKQSYMLPIPFFLLAGGVVFLGLRGTGITPIDQSDAYFSENDFANTAAINSTFNLARSIESNIKQGDKNPYNFFTKEELNKRISDLYEVKKDTTISILKTSKPNIVYIILEGFSSDLIGANGGYKKVTPTLDSIIKNGYNFTNVVSPGLRSHVGMISIFSGFPALPTVNVATQRDKFTNLPNFVKDIKKLGYETGYIFGGDLKHGKVLDYIFNCHFDHLIKGEDFSGDIPTGKLGVADEYLFERKIQEIDKMKPPFMMASFTLSTHSPFDYPMKDVFKFGGGYQQYINSGHYTDKALKEFFRVAATKPWYKNTLFVITADHSHPTPNHWENFVANKSRIPLVFFGDAIKEEYRGIQNSKYASQLDISSTVLHQLGLDAKEYQWSKNLFNPNTKGFGFYVFNDAYGLVSQNENVFYNHETKKTVYQPEETFYDKNKEEDLKALLQALYDEYLKL